MATTRAPYPSPGRRPARKLHPKRRRSQEAAVADEYSYEPLISPFAQRRHTVKKCHTSMPPTGVQNLSRSCSLTRRQPSRGQGCLALNDLASRCHQNPIKTRLLRQQPVGVWLSAISYDWGSHRSTFRQFPRLWPDSGFVGFPLGGKWEDSDNFPEVALGILGKPRTIRPGALVRRGSG